MIFKQISADSDRANHADVWRRSPDIGNKKRPEKRKGVFRIFYEQ